jgi:hypothetical protein
MAFVRFGRRRSLPPRRRRRRTRRVPTRARLARCNERNTRLNHPGVEQRATSASAAVGSANVADAQDTGARSSVSIALLRAPNKMRARPDAALGTARAFVLGSRRSATTVTILRPRPA